MEFNDQSGLHIISTAALPFGPREEANLSPSLLLLSRLCFNFSFHDKLNHICDHQSKIKRPICDGILNHLPPLPNPPTNDTVRTILNTPTHVALKSEELIRMEQELKDREIEMPKAREDLNRRIHDDQVAREIMKIP
ncbi:hypothetical protein L3X38_015589 [Prunus dulcis]|uniref:Uncharacterized protein n=1 Tax=Prunus dulcis TaxID=3755 RepID=A0AAD4Z7D8_PRUDU|nr:hypothetical protein L3X38_015589 [Prunus dulcis]